MTDKPSDTFDAVVPRFGTLLLLVVVIVGGLTAGSTVAVDAPLADQHSPENQTHSLESNGFIVKQGDRCIPVTPFGDGTESVGAYYDYRNPNSTPSSYTYSSYGTTDLQKDDTSVLFAHEGVDGLTLVVIHDRLEGSTDGGSVTMQFDDLPTDGKWAVEDDAYEGRDDVFSHRETSSRITWVWTEGRSDGAAFSGLGEDFAVTVTPAFNEAADFRYTDGGYDGQLTDWQVLSSADGELERTSLAMDEPIEVRSGSCSAVTALSVDGNASVGDEVTIEATVTNEGERAETVTVPFVVDGAVVDEQDVTVEAGATTTISATVSVDEAGTRAVSVGEAAAELEVTNGDFGDSLPGFGVSVALIAITTVVLLGRRS